LPGYGLFPKEQLWGASSEQRTDVNAKQKWVLEAGIVVAVLIGLYPPWQFVVHWRTSEVPRQGPYGLLFDSPQPPTKTGPFGGVEDAVTGWPITSVETRLDTQRLAVEWITLIFVVSGLLLLFRSPSGRPSASNPTGPPSPSVQSDSEPTVRHGDGAEGPSIMEIDRGTGTIQLEDPLTREQYDQLIADRPPKASPANVNYRRGTGRDLCRECVHFFTSRPQRRSVCQIMRPKNGASVFGDFTCDFFTRDGKTFPLLKEEKVAND